LPSLIFTAAKGEFLAAAQGKASPMADAAIASLKGAATTIQTQGRANIAAAGFTKRWQTGFRATLNPNKGLDATVTVRHSMGFASVFEFGGRISGKPLLWIPVDGMPARIGGKRTTIALYIKLIGPLRFVHLPGHPPMAVGPIAGLAGARITVAKLRRGQAGQGRRIQTAPLFVGVPAVTVGKHFNLTAIVNQAVAQVPEAFAQNFRDK
jgi:hypothetical protein